MEKKIGNNNMVEEKDSRCFSNVTQADQPTNSRFASIINEKYNKAGTDNMIANSQIGHIFGTQYKLDGSTILVNSEGYQLIIGGFANIKFTEDVPAGATLNISNKGKRAILYQGAPISEGIILKGDTALLQYDGKNYNLSSIDRWQVDIDRIDNENKETQQEIKDFKESLKYSNVLLVLSNVNSNNSVKFVSTNGQTVEDVYKIFTNKNSIITIIYNERVFNCTNKIDNSYTFQTVLQNGMIQYFTLYVKNNYVYVVSEGDNWLNTYVFQTNTSEQIQSDWEEKDVNSKAFIKNKPIVLTTADLTSLATRLSRLESAINNFSGNTPTYTEQVQSNWAESNLSSPAYIKNKPTLSKVATTGNYYDLQNIPTQPGGTCVVDADWIEGSQNPIQSKLIKQELDGIKRDIGNINIEGVDLTEIERRLDLLEGNQISNITINPQTGNWIINNQQTSFPSRGQMPSLKVGEDGYWYVNNEKQTACQAVGPKGEDGQTAYLSDMSNSGNGLVGMGSFQQAYDAAEANPDSIFAWILDELDDNSNRIVKTIYHIGSKHFIDALGATIVGRTSGITIS